MNILNKIQNKLKYQKPLLHVSFLWIGFLLSSVLIGTLFYIIFPIELFLILGFISLSLSAFLFFTLLTPFFYNRKYNVKGIKDFIIFERADFFTVSFCEDFLPKPLKRKPLDLSMGMNF